LISELRPMRRSGKELLGNTAGEWLASDIGMSIS
jgi:hypothetical protein